MSQAALALLLPWVLGAALCLLALPGAGRSWRLWPVLGAGLGLGLSGLLCSLWLFWAGPPGVGYFLAESGLAAIALVWLWRRPGLLAESPCTAAPAAPLALSVLWWLLLSAACVWFMLQSAYHAHGRWDAWAIWNLRARFLLRAGDQWRLAMSPVLSWSHPDYPLLLPALVMRGWRLVGTELTWLPAMVAGVYTFASVLLVRGVVGALRGGTQGDLAGLAMLANYSYLQHGASQYADVELAFFILASIVLLVLAQVHPLARLRLLGLAGLAAGLAAWTKNEGMLFALLFAGVSLASVCRRAGAVGRWRAAASLLLGMSPALLVIAWFRLALPAESDLLNAHTVAAFWQHVADPARYLMISAAFARELAGLGSGIVIIVLLYGWWVGRTPAPAYRIALRAGAWTLALLLTGYFCVYVITPHDLRWHLGTTLSRLLLQLWPAAVFLWVVGLRTPQAH